MDTAQEAKGKGKAVDHPPQDMSMDEDEDSSEESAGEQEVGRSHVVCATRNLSIHLHDS